MFLKKQEKNNYHTVQKENDDINDTSVCAKC